MVTLAEKLSDEWREKQRMGAAAKSNVAVIDGDVLVFKHCQNCGADRVGLEPVYRCGARQTISEERIDWVKLCPVGQAGK